MKSDIQNALTNLHTRSPEALWGISARSIYLSLCSVVDEHSMETHLTPHRKTTILRTNDERDQATVVSTHQLLHTELGLISETEELSDQGRLVLGATQPVAAVRLVAAKQLERIRYFLREFEALDTNQLPRSELETLVRDSRDADFIAPLLSSLGFIDLYPEGVILSRETIQETLELASRDIDQVSASIALVSTLTGLEKPSLVASVTSEYLGKDVPADLVETISFLDGLAAVKPGSHRTPVMTFEEAIHGVRTALEAESEQLRDAFDPESTASVSTRTVGAETISESFPEDNPTEANESYVVDLLSTINTHPYLNQLPIDSLSSELGVDSYEIYQVFSTIPGVECRIRDDIVLVFDAVPTTVGTDRYDEFRDQLFDAVCLRDSWTKALETTVFESPRMRESIIESLLTEVDEGVVTPTYFVYTLPDPDALGEEQMDRYADGQPALRREQARLKRWKEQRRNDIRRFTEMTDQLFSLGQERDLEDRIVRIMTPYDDDTFSEYTSQLRSLLRDGYEIRLLTRHTRQKWQWERLRDNLLGDLEENRENVRIRTYSRYKEYQRITGDIDETNLKEFGIHAKLQTIGHASEGAALLGSANFMENSYNWNPECGVYTENENFVTAAIEFFDHVWELSEADEVDLSSLQEIPKRSFYPSYYT